MHRLRLKPGKNLPESTTIRLRDLFAVDKDGNDLRLGCAPLEVVFGQPTADQPSISLSSTRLFPNPTSGYLAIEPPCEGPGLLFNMNGRIVRSWTAADLASSLDINDLPSGLYFLKLRGTGEVLKVMRQ